MFAIILPEIQKRRQIYFFNTQSQATGPSENIAEEVKNGQLKLIERTSDGVLRARIADKSDLATGSKVISVIEEHISKKPLGHPMETRAAKEALLRMSTLIKVLATKPSGPQANNG